jgi:hypothetical protein
VIIFSLSSHMVDNINDGIDPMPKSFIMKHYDMSGLNTKQA